MRYGFGPVQAPHHRSHVSNDDNDRYRAPALDKGLDILELLAEQPHGLTRAEIVRAMGRSQSEIYRMLERLVARHYVTRSTEGDRYALSLKMFVLGSRHPPVERLIARALPLMDGFCKASEQSCHLSVHDRGNLTVVAQVNSPSTWSLSLRLGARVSLLGTGSGHVLLAFQTPQRRLEMLREHEPMEGETPIDAAELDAMLDKVRAAGGWQGRSRQAEGVVDLSLPVLGTHDEAIAVLTCPYVRRIDRHLGADVDTTREMLHEAAAALSFQ
jgi:DNA-binding IclR family transcriptional regulator